MKTILHIRTILLNFTVALLFLLAGNSATAQTYTTVANGPWNLASTWQSGNIPPAGNIASSAVVNIKHIVSYLGASFSNNGTINITNQQGVSPRLTIPTGVNITNNASGKINIINGELRQYRFILGLEVGVPQTGIFKNNGGYVQVSNSFVEFAQDWSNEGNGIVVFRNSSLVIGQNYDVKNTAKDTIENSSISIGMHGSGDYTSDGAGTYFKAARIQVASTNGRFNLKTGIFNGSIDYIMLKNHVTGIYSSDKIEASSGIVTTGLSLKAYCISNASNYRPNGKITGTQTKDCSLSYFPAGLMGSTSSASLNFSATPVLTSGTALQVGATYKYEGVTPGVDAIVKVDSLVKGATITRIDDNTGGLGYMEGFQPEIKDGPTSGESYAVFTIEYKIAGTSIPHKMNTFSITALDIDGASTLKEFDQIDLGPGATAAYNASPTNISLSQVSSGVYRAINTDGKTINGIDTSARANMFTVTNADVSSFTLKLGTVKTNNSQTSRQFGIYMKGFVYAVLATLPVKLQSFTAQLNDDKADLKWITSYEKDVSHFSIEKSLDGRNFAQAGVVFAFGNSSGILNYTFADKNINTSQPGIIYYRLRSIDIDGKSELSAVRMITIGNQNRQATAILTYPNPVSNELRITIPTSWQGKQVIYEIIGSNGQVNKKSMAASASQTEALNLNSLAPGFYVARAICNGEVAQQKILKR